MTDQSPARPVRMTALAVVCLLALAINVPRDLFFAETRDVEVWLGFELHGRIALLTAPFHWAIFAVGAWGFWKQRPWAVPAAVGYVFYVAASHLVWSEVSPNGRGWPIGMAQAAALSAVGMLLLRTRHHAN
jgi:hypothetical protein